MKVLICLAAIAVACSAVSEEEAWKQWKDFQVQFGRSFRSPHEHQKRFNIFKENLEEFEAHNKRYEAGEVTYTLGVGPFADLTREEFANRFAGEPEEIEDSDLPLYTPLNVTFLPTEFDWRRFNVITRVKDQGQCNSCWAFAALGAVEAQYGISTGNEIDLSEQALVDCSTTTGCGGGLATSAYNYIKKNGVPLESSYPYTARAGSCQPFQPELKVKSFVNVPSDEAAMADAIYNQGPIAVSIDAHGDLMHYGGGVLVDKSCTVKPNHAVLAVGFGTENGQDFWIIRNSYGTRWGEQGYFKLARGINNCGITKRPSYPIYK